MLYSGKKIIIPVGANANMEKFLSKGAVPSIIIAESTILGLRAKTFLLSKDKIEQIVSEWESKEKAEEKLDMSVRTFYKKAKEAKVPTILSESINKLKDLGAKKEEIQMYLDEGATPQKICEMYDISPELYHSLVRKYCLVSSAKMQSERTKSITKEQLEQMIQSGKSQKEICKELGISSGTLHKRLEYFGIKT